MCAIFVEKVTDLLALKICKTRDNFSQAAGQIYKLNTVKIPVLPLFMSVFLLTAGNTPSMR